MQPPDKKHLTKHCHLCRKVAEQPKWLPQVAQVWNALDSPSNREEVPDDKSAPQGEVKTVRLT
jgi:hypothetical protein